MSDLASDFGAFARAMGNDGTRLPHDIQYNGHSNFEQSDPYISMSWLEGKESWPQCLEQTLKTFMRDNQWYSYKKKEDDSDRKMERVLAQLQQFFDFKEWDQSAKEKLKKKIRSKMYRLNSADPLTKFRNALRELSNETHYEAARDVVETFGEERVGAVLNEVRGDIIDTGTAGMDLINWNGTL